MDTALINIGLIASVAGAVFFTIMWVTSRYALSKATPVEKANLAIEEAKAEEEKKPWRERLRLKLASYGWTGNLAPLVAVLVFGYIVLTLGLRAAGAPELAAVAIALPASIGIMTAVAKRTRSRKQLLFRRQLAQALNMLASQIEAGNGPQRALEQIVGSLDDPLGTELAGALSQTIASKDLIAALETLAERYPSKALDLFVSALEIDRMQGGSLGPSLRQAAALLEREFELAEEAQAEISQAKAEFYAIVAIISGIAVVMFTSSDTTVREAYFSPIGISVLGFTLINFAVGIYRSLSMFTAVKDQG